MTGARDFRVEEALRGGLAVVIRAVRPDDRASIARAFANLERETIYTRYFGHKSELTPRELGAIDTMDFVRDVMLVLTTTIEGGEIVIASARYIAYADGQGALAAEIAFTVEEDYQGRGIASRLLHHLTTIALGNGVGRFEADVLPENKAMLAVFERSGLSLRRRVEGGVIHVDLALA